jgi:hypothetical protein
MIMKVHSLIGSQNDPEDHPDIKEILEEMARKVFLLP